MRYQACKPWASADLALPVDGRCGRVRGRKAVEPVGSKVAVDVGAVAKIGEALLIGYQKYVATSHCAARLRGCEKYLGLPKGYQTARSVNCRGWRRDYGDSKPLPTPLQVVLSHRWGIGSPFG